MSNNQELTTSHDEGSDPRLAHVLSLLNYESEDDVTDSDYERIEDAFISQTQEVISSGTDFDALRAAGFSVLADSLAELGRVSDAYNWSRENL